jgi:hypothetical protein
MDQDKVVNKILRDMKLMGIIPEEMSGDARPYLNAIWVASYEQRTKELLAHHKKAVIQFNRTGQEISSFPSVVEAALANHCSRDVVDDSITGRVPMTRKGYYFRYAKDVAP